MSPRIGAFILVRLLALLWVLALVHLAQPLGAYAISLLIIISEVLLGFVWGRAESQITVCKPKTPDVRRLYTSMVFVGIIETIGAVVVAAFYAPWLIVWRVVTAYLPFSIAEGLTFKKLCEK